MSIRILPAYSPERFLNREREIAFIKGSALGVSNGRRKPAQPNVITIRGERGTGKTWLALHLSRTILPEISGAIPLLMSFMDTLDRDSYLQGEIEEKNESFIALDEILTETPDNFFIEHIEIYFFTNTQMWRDPWERSTSDRHHQ